MKSPSCTYLPYIFFSVCIEDTWMEFRRGTVSLRGSSFVYPAKGCKLEKILDLQNDFHSSPTLCSVTRRVTRTQNRAWMEVILTVQTFFQFASFGWVNKTRPSKGNRASSELHPSISNAVWKIKFVMNELWRVRVAQIFSLQNEDSKWVAKIQLLILQIPAILDTNTQHFYMFLQKKSIKSCFY